MSLDEAYTQAGPGVNPSCHNLKTFECGQYTTDAQISKGCGCLLAGDECRRSRTHARALLVLCVRDPCWYI